MKNLDERSVWIFFVQNIFIFSFSALMLAMMAMPFLVQLFFSYKRISYLPYIGNIGLFFVFIVIFSYIWAILYYKSYKYELSPNGFKKESGVIYKRYVTIPYGKIQNIDIVRGIMARILGLSDLVIQTAGLSTPNRVEGLLPGISYQDAEKLRDELVLRSENKRDNSV